MLILGIETSCDETAAAVVQDGSILLSNAIASSMDLHKAFGGVVPEIAARSHIEVINPIIKQALDEAKTGWDDIDAIAVTQGPGLGGSLLIGVLTARTYAITKHKPLYAVDHVMAHPFATFINETNLAGYSLPASQPKFPMLALIVSGGHTQLVLFRSPFDYSVVGKTQDDAVGEAFDKVAKMLGLPYPGGPSISNSATQGDPHRYVLPDSRMPSPYDFSFSGLKTAVLRVLQAESGQGHDFPSFRLPEALSKSQVHDMAASFQFTAVQTLVSKTLRALIEFQPASIVVAGGVSANQELRSELENQLPLQPIYTDLSLCTDNGAMIAVLGGYMHKAGMEQADPYMLDIRPNLPM